LARRKKILVLQSEKLLAASISSLLASRSKLEVINTTVGSLACFDQPGRLHLDVVILDEELLAANIAAVVKLTERQPTLRLIVFGLSDNKLHVFDKQVVQVRQISDFIELL